MRSIYTFYASLLFFACCLAGCTRSKHPTKEGEDETTGAMQAMQWQIKRTMDPSLGYVPNERLLAAKAFRDKIAPKNLKVIDGISWKTLGPKNQAGRTRTILVDARDNTGKTVFAGSVGGGLWKTTDISAASPNWLPINDLLGNLAVTSITQDPSNLNTIYLSTGEGFYNGDAIRGLGVWKSTDGGTNWVQLAATNFSSFYYCQKIMVNSAGVVFVGTHAGLFRSANGGTSFTKVLGTGLGITGAVSNSVWDIEIAANGHVFASLNGTIHKSTNNGVNFGAAMTLPITGQRIELACAPNDANYVYAILEFNSIINGIIKSTDGGTTWISKTEPDDADPGIPNTDFSRQQAWYDLSIAVDPNHRDSVYVGAIDIFKSVNGGNTWQQISHWYGGFGYQYVHADQHMVLFRKDNSSEAYFANDGGIYRCTNANAALPTISDQGSNYITAQFYACAMLPTALSYYFLAGSQDNGSHQFNSGSLSNTLQVTGGDGAYCHIDQNEPQYQFTSYVYNDYYRSSDGGVNWTNVSTSGGQFINPTDYDDTNNKMYCSNDDTSYIRWDNPQTGSTFTKVRIGVFNAYASAIKVSPNTANRVFFGLSNGKLIKVDNAHTATPTATSIGTGLPTGNLNCVEVQTGNDNHILAVYSNYGLTSVWETLNGGTLWTQVEGNLPDMPIYWALFNPSNNDQAIIATELGVWTTDNLNGNTTVWGTSNSGLANVRVDMLQTRTSDKMMIAATHGRGLFVSDFFTTPTALFTVQKSVGYSNNSFKLSSTSTKATSWLWNFGDGSSSTVENPNHVYSNSGKYTVTLSINNGASTITKTDIIKILPSANIPYLIANGGGFEVFPDHFGADSVSGTNWTRGSSLVSGKNGTNGGSNAWVTGLTGNYQILGESSLLTPNYTFNSPGMYTLKFWSKFKTENNYDGFRVEYSTNSGVDWLPLGTTTSVGWYNFANNSGDAVFPINEAFFSGTVSSFTRYAFNISNLVGNSGFPKQIAFRFRFKSDEFVNNAGAVIDDVEITGPQNTWNGTVNENWSNVGNWDGQQLPSATSDVVIPSIATRMPKIDVNTTVKSIKAMSGANITINSNVSLTIKGKN